MFKEIKEKVYCLESGVEGPNLLVFGGIHGDEPCGVYAIERFMKELSDGKWELLNGSITFAYGNLEALAQKKRYVDYNMNRMFGLESVGLESVEYERVRMLETLFEGKDAFLDLHSASSKAPDFMMAEKNAFDLACSLGPSFVVSGWEKFADVGGDTECYANSLGLIGMTYEAGQHNDPLALENAYKVLLRFLAVYGVIDYEFSIDETPTMILSEVILKKSDSDKWLIPVENMQFVSKGTAILQLDDSQFAVPFDCYLVFPTACERVKVGEELCFLAN